MRGHSDIDGQLDPTSREIGMASKVVSFFSDRRSSVPEAVPASSEPSLTDRLADLLAQVLDEPLAVLPGCPEGPSSTELRFAHYRPDLSALAASLLEEAGR